MISKHPWTTSFRPPSTRPAIEEFPPGTSEAISGCERVQEGDVITVPQDGQHPGICSNCLPVPPMRRQTTPHLQQRQDPTRRTSSRPLFVCHRSGRRPPKRAPHPCDPSNSNPAGKRKRRGLSKPAAATEKPRVKHRPGQWRRPTKTLPWTVQPKTSEESKEGATSAEQERRSKPCASWSVHGQARK